MAIIDDNNSTAFQARMKTCKITCLFLVALMSVQFGVSASAEESSSDSKSAVELRPRVLFPLVFYTPETSVGLGLIWIENLWQVRPGKNSYIQSTLTTTTKQQWTANIMPRLYSKDGEREGFAAFSYSFFPNQYYGNQNAHLDSPEKETENNLSLLVSGSQRVFSNLFVRSFAQTRELKITQTADGGLLEQQLTQKGFRNLKSVAWGLGLDWDTRDFPQSPTSGLWIRLQSQKVWLEDRDSTRTQFFYANELDFRIYDKISISEKWRDLVLANQVFVGALTDSDVPFQFLYAIGGNQSLRGYYQGQYRNRTLAMNQNELRGEINDRFGWAAFLSFARLGDGASEISAAETLIAGGGGVNYMLDPANRIKLKVDVGVSRENRGAYFVLGESF